MLIILDLQNNPTGSVLKQQDFCEFFVETMQNLKSKRCVENTSESVSDSEWYLPYFVTSQAKKRIAYNGKSEYKGVYINDVIVTGPDLTRSLPRSSINDLVFSVFPSNFFPQVTKSIY